MTIYKKILDFIQKYSSISNLSKKELFFLGSFLFVIKLLLVVIISFFDWKEGLSFFTSAMDNVQYIGYSENLYQHGEYYYDFGISEKKDYLFRMPGITFLYLPLRLLFSQTLTLNLFVILQVLIATFATIKFLEVVNRYLKVNNLFFFFFSILYFYFSLLEASLMPDSLGLSSLLLCIYFVDNANANAKHKKFVYKNLLLAGFFMMWLVFLRPFMIPFVLLFAGYIFLRSKKLLYVFIFLSAFIVADSLWIARNYFNHGEVIPLQTSANWYKGKSISLLSKISFIQSFGFKWAYFEENTQAAWFNNKYESPSIKIPPNSIFPDRTFVGDLTIDSLIRAREFMHKVINTDLDSISRIRYDLESARILDKFVSELKENDPFDYYIGNRIRLLLSFLEPNTSKLFIHGPYPFNVIVSKTDKLFNLIIKYFGFLGLLILTIKSMKKIDVLVLFLSVPLYIFILFTFVLRIDETRFLYLSLPFLIVCSFYFLKECQRIIFKLTRR